MKVAIIHDFLTQYGGAEKVLEALHEIWPEAPIFTLFYDKKKLGDKFKNDRNIKWHRWHLVRGLASCSFWWASANDFTTSFGPYAWNPDIVERGLSDLLRSVRAIEDKKSLKDKLKAEALALRLKKNLWRCHWLKHWS